MQAWAASSTTVTTHQTQPAYRRVRRHPERASYCVEDAYSILDEALVAHVSFTMDARPFIVPMGFGRDGNRLLLHGARGSRIYRQLAKGIPATVAVTLLDGLVLARSTFHHSMNYRSVVVFGQCEPITDIEDKDKALELLVEHIVPGRSQDARRPTRQELEATGLLAMPIEDFSIKRRSGPPVDDPADLDFPCWAGVLPTHLALGQPQPDSSGSPPPECPDYVERYRR
ncbi:pyridoxamine 5'-phosphate oxidase family protein [Spiribacter halobius]|uniref:Pyridoxamine 5'-phosphate oxidase family protein n=1 Tax=Sediminicurvatus halobius TaxID=2182432 RepID=A0A2U2N9I7_9GAMM|nr:pyridoxamine 5'-phosphate oxidase family protein [Spiribacter halobius]